MRPVLAWLGRWGISLASLAGGLAALFVFRRGLPHVAWIVGYLLLLWLLFAVLTQVRRSLSASSRRSRRLIVAAADYTIQLARNVGKVVFFAKHIDVMDTAEAAFAQQGLRYSSIRGDQTPKARQLAIDSDLPRRRSADHPARLHPRNAARSDQEP